MEKLKQCLEQIGWSISGVYPNRRIYDFEGKGTPYRVMNDRVEISNINNSAVCFYFDDCEIKVLETGDAVSIGTEKLFILFMNHKMGRNNPELLDGEVQD